MSYLLISQTELRREWRTMSSERKLVSIAAGGCLLLLLVVSMAASQTEYVQVPLLSLAERRAILEWSGILLVGLTVGTVAGRTIKAGGIPDAAPFLMTSVSDRCLLLGLLLKETIHASISVVIPIVILVVSALSVAGISTVALVGTVPVFLPPIVVASVIIGYAIGLSICYWIGNLNKSMRAWLGLFSAGTIIIGLFWEPMVWELSAVLIPDPIAAVSRRYITSLFVGTTIQPTFPVWGVILWLSAIGLVPVLFILSLRISREVWFDTRTTDSNRSRGGSVLLNAFDRTRSLQCAAYLLLRSYRNSIRFVPIIVTFIQATIPFTPIIGYFGFEPFIGLTPYIIGFAGVLLAGSSFGYNPLGDEEAMLPEILLASPQTSVRARIVAGYSIGVPVAFFGPMLTGWLLWGTVVEPILVALFSAVGVLCSPPLALYFGSVFPSFTTETVIGGGTVTWPKRRVIVLFTSICTYWYVSGTLFLFLPDLVAVFSPLSETLIRGLGMCTIVAAATVGIIAYKRSVRRIQSYRSEYWH